MTNIDGNGVQLLQFVNRNESQECEGTTNQEALRALIARLQYMDKQMHWPLNEEIIQHLRMAIALHEARALIRKVDKDQMDIENYPTASDGHLIFSKNDITRDINNIPSRSDGNPAIDTGILINNTINHRIKEDRDKCFKKDNLDNRIKNSVTRARFFLASQEINASVEQIISSGIDKCLIKLISHCGRAARYYSSSTFRLGVALTMLTTTDHQYILRQYRSLCTGNTDNASNCSLNIMRLVKSGRLESSNKLEQLYISLCASDYMSKDLIAKDLEHISDVKINNSIRYLTSVLLDKITQP